MTEGRRTPASRPSPPHAVRRLRPALPVRPALIAVLPALIAVLLVGGCGGPTVRTAPESAAQRTVELEGRVHLRLVLPRGYELQSETGGSFDIYNVWRVPPLPVDKDTSLGIFVGRPLTAYCRPRTGSFQPAAFSAWRVRWHTCGVTEGPGQQIWETHIRGHTREPLHIFILGPDAPEVQRLKRIAESLVPVR